MNLSDIKTYEIKTSKTGEKLPVIDDVHLHSIYNPIKEAQSIAQKYSEQIQKKNNILIFGLGFAYHVREIEKIAQEHHGDNYSIIVIEPNAKIARDCRELNIIEEKNITIYAGQEVTDLYRNLSLVEFLTQKPAIIAHPSSFNLYREYFKSFLAHEASSDKNKALSIITNERLYNYINAFEDFSSIDDLIDNKILQQVSLKNENDHIMLAYRHLITADF